MGSIPEESEEGVVKPQESLQLDLGDWVVTGDSGAADNPTITTENGVMV